ncbi:unnamed protein product, partial [Sphacelaria rigidula]
MCYFLLSLSVGLACLLFFPCVHFWHWNEDKERNTDAFGPACDVRKCEEKKNTIYSKYFEDRTVLWFFRCLRVNTCSSVPEWTGDVFVLSRILWKTYARRYWSVMVTS